MIRKRGKSVTAITGCKWILFIKAEGEVFRIAHLCEHFYSRCVVCFNLCFCLLLNIRSSSNNIDKLHRKKTANTTWFMKLYWQRYSNIWEKITITFWIDPTWFLRVGRGCNTPPTTHPVMARLWYVPAAIKLYLLTNSL